MPTGILFQSRHFSSVFYIPLYTLWIFLCRFHNGIHSRTKLQIIIMIQNKIINLIVFLFCPCQVKDKIFLNFFNAYLKISSLKNYDSISLTALCIPLVVFFIKLSSFLLASSWCKIISIASFIVS